MERGCNCFMIMVIVLFGLGGFLMGNSIGYGRAEIEYLQHPGMFAYASLQDHPELAK